MNEISTLGYHLDIAFTALVGKLNQELEGLGINHSQFIILQLLNSKSGLSQNDIARALNRNPAAVSRSLNCLNRQGLVHITAISGCCNCVELTEKAIALRGEIYRIIKNIQEEATKDFSEGEYNDCINFLERIFNNITNTTNENNESKGHEMA